MHFIYLKLTIGINFIVASRQYTWYAQTVGGLDARASQSGDKR